MNNNMFNNPGDHQQKSNLDAGNPGLGNLMMQSPSFGSDIMRQMQQQLNQNQSSQSNFPNGLMANSLLMSAFQGQQQQPRHHQLQQNAPMTAESMFAAAMAAANNGNGNMNQNNSINVVRPTNSDTSKNDSLSSNQNLRVTALSPTEELDPDPIQDQPQQKDSSGFQQQSGMSQMQQILPQHQQQLQSLQQINQNNNGLNGLEGFEQLQNLNSFQQQQNAVAGNNIPLIQGLQQQIASLQQQVQQQQQQQRHPQQNHLQQQQLTSQLQPNMIALPQQQSQQQQQRQLQMQLQQQGQQQQQDQGRSQPQQLQIQSQQQPQQQVQQSQQRQLNHSGQQLLQQQQQQQQQLGQLPLWMNQAVSAGTSNPSFNQAALSFELSNSNSSNNSSGAPSNNNSNNSMDAFGGFMMGQAAAMNSMMQGGGGGGAFAPNIFMGSNGASGMQPFFQQMQQQQPNQLQPKQQLQQQPYQNQHLQSNQMQEQQQIQQQQQQQQQQYLTLQQNQLASLSGQFNQAIMANMGNNNNSSNTMMNMNNSGNKMSYPTIFPQIPGVVGGSAGLAPDTDNGDIPGSPLRKHMRKEGKKKRVKTFPEKLMNALLEFPNEDAAAWLPDGKSFVVVNPELFCNEILAKAFKETKYASFVRKLHRWGFVRLTSGTGTDCFYHPLFQRNKREMVGKIASVPRDTKDKDRTSDRFIKPPSLAGVEKFIKSRGNQAVGGTRHNGLNDVDLEDEDDHDDEKQFHDAEIDRSSDAQLMEGLPH